MSRFPFGRSAGHAAWPFGAAFRPALLVGFLFLSLPVTVVAAPLSRARAADADHKLRTLTRALACGDVAARVRAAKALRACGSAAVPALRRALKDPDLGVRQEALEALADLGPAAADAAADLDALRRDDTDLSVNAVQALGALGPAGTHFLVAALDDVDRLVQNAALQTLREAASVPCDAIPFLQRILERPLAEVEEENFDFRAAPECLGRCGVQALPAIEHLLRSRECIQRMHALYALQAMGEPGRALVDLATQAVADEEPNVRQAAIEAVRVIAPADAKVVAVLALALDDPFPGVAEAALETLDKWDKAADIPLSAFRRRLFSGSSATVDVLRRRGEPAIPVLLEGLESHDSREASARALAQMGPAGITALRQAQDHPCIAVRLVALTVLARTVQDPVPVLRRAFNDEIPQVRLAAAQWAPAVPALVPALLQASEESSYLVRQLALQTLARMDPLPPEVIARLRAGLHDEKSDVRLAAAEGLINRPAGDNMALAQERARCLTDLLVSEAVCIRLHAAKLLGKNEHDARAAAKSLQRALGDPDRSVVVAAAVALRLADKTHEITVPLPLEAAQEDPAPDDPPEEPGDEAFTGLEKMARESDAAILTLAAAVEGTDSVLRQRALRALRALGGRARPALPALIRAADHESLQVGVEAVAALGPCGPDARPTLRRILRGPWPDLQIAVCGALGDLGDAAADEAPALVAALGDRNPRVREAAAEALGQLGPRARAVATAALAEAAFDRDHFVRDAAARALRRLQWGPPAPGTAAEAEFLN